MAEVDVTSNMYAASFCRYCEDRVDRLATGISVSFHADAVWYRQSRPDLEAAFIAELAKYRMGLSRKRWPHSKYEPRGE